MKQSVLAAHRRAASALAVSVTLAWFGVTSPVFGQSAADKATARQAATEGIRLYQEGKYAEALDRLKRAQALYDAPPHLLYIARSQVKLPEPMLVEAAENYRLLLSQELPQGAPPAFVQAIEDGRKELAELEPRIPTLQIEVTPDPPPSDLALTIDGVSVAAAVVGLPRPTNPGQRVVAATASGHARAEKTQDISEGQQVTLTLELVQDPNATASTTPAPAAADGRTAKDDEEPGLVGFMVGLRLGAAIPAGSLGSFAGQADVDTTDVFKSGGGLELHGGVRIAQLVTLGAFGEFSALTASDDLTSLRGLDKSALAHTLGFMAMVGTPRGRIGGYGEVGIAFSHQFALTASPRGVPDCTVTMTATSPALRIGGGGVFPIGKFVHLVPLAALTLGEFNEVDVQTSGTCPSGVALPSGNIPQDERKFHTLLFIGVGGDFVFGPDRPRD